MSSYDQHLLDLFGLSEEDVETVPADQRIAYLTLRVLADMRSALNAIQAAQVPAPAPVTGRTRTAPTGAVKNIPLRKANDSAVGSIQNEKIGRPAIEGAPQASYAKEPRAPETVGMVENEKIGFQNREEVMAIIQPTTVGGVLTPNQKIMPNIQNMMNRSHNIPGGRGAGATAPAQATVQGSAVQSAPPVSQATTFTNVEANAPQQVFTQDSQLPPVPQKGGEESDGRNISFN